MAKMQPACVMSAMELVMAPLPKVRSKPATVGECQRRAQWSMELVPNTARANFCKHIVVFVGAFGRSDHRHFIGFVAGKSLCHGVEGVVPGHRGPFLALLDQGLGESVRMVDETGDAEASLDAQPDLDWPVRSGRHPGG